MVEQLMEADGVQLCAESFGDPADPPVLLVMGIGGSMLGWEEGFCRILADGGRFVIRYDHRDTGRSVTYEPGRRGYSGTNLVADAAAVLDGFDVRAAHIVGVSAAAEQERTGDAAFGVAQECVDRGALGGATDEKVAPLRRVSGIGRARHDAPAADAPKNTITSERPVLPNVPSPVAADAARDLAASGEPGQAP